MFFGMLLASSLLVEIGQNVTTQFATINYLQLHLDIFATISFVGHIYDYTGTILVFILPCEQHLVWFSSKKNNLFPISYKCEQFSYNPMSIQRCIL
jgi:hypothetical protein